MTLLTAADYPTVRAALDTSLDATALPDGVIGMTIYQGRAEALVMARDPQWATRSGDALEWLRRAAIAYTAAFLAPAVPTLASEYLGDYRYVRNQASWDERAKRLLAEGAAAVAKVIAPSSTTAPRPAVFALATGGRGQ